MGSGHFVKYDQWERLIGSGERQGAEGVENDMPMTSRKCPVPGRLRFLGERREFPYSGVQSRAPAESEFDSLIYSILVIMILMILECMFYIRKHSSFLRHINNENSLYSYNMRFTCVLAAFSQ